MSEAVVWSDGAHLNIGVEDAAKAIIGGQEQPEPITDEQFESMIWNAPIHENLGYNGGGNAMARIILEAYEKYPELQDLADEYVYLGDTLMTDNPIVLNVTLYDVLKKLHDTNSPEYKFVMVELTGFMFGWALNAARKIRGLSPMQNPALMVLGTKGE